MDQQLVRGSRFMAEVAFLHRPSRTLVLVDLLENVTDRTEHVNTALRFWFKWVFRMWNRPRPAPEYQLGWADKQAAAHSLRTILGWDFDRVVIAHGENLISDAKAVLEWAWATPLLVARGCARVSPQADADARPDRAATHHGPRPRRCAWRRRR